MSEIDKGVLIYNEWFDAMENLNPKDFKAFIYAMYNYQIHDVPPPEFKGMSAMMSSMIFPYIKRRKKQAAIGKLGAEARLARASEPSRSASRSPAPLSTKYSSGSPFAAPSIAPSTASSIASSIAPSTAPSTASCQSIVENSIEENKIAEHILEERSIPCSSQGDSAEAQISEANAPDTDALALADKQGGYGIYKNVFLSTEEYALIKNTIKDAEKYIDNFSVKLYSKGYRYPNHAKAILEWWAKDSRLPSSHDGASFVPDVTPTSEHSSFDTDEFFEAAVRRSLGG